MVALEQLRKVKEQLHETEKQLHATKGQLRETKARLKYYTDLRTRQPGFAYERAYEQRDRRGRRSEDRGDSHDRLDYSADHSRSAYNFRECSSGRHTYRERSTSPRNYRRNCSERSPSPRNYYRSYREDSRERLDDRADHCRSDCDCRECSLDHRDDRERSPSPWDYRRHHREISRNSLGYRNGTDQRYVDLVSCAFW